MPTVGTVIVSTRRKIPDPTPTLPTPSAVFSVVAGTGTLPAGSYYAKATQLNAFGETLPSTESGVLAVSGTQVIQCVSTLLPGAVTLRVYLTMVGGAAGSEIAFQDFTASPATVSAFPATASQPPVMSTAYLPDADGQTFSAAAVFGWMNDGLNQLSHAVGGILDYCGVMTQAGNGLYVVPGQWLTITDVWYGGYWIKGGRRAEYFRRNQVTSNVLQMATISITSNKQVIEVTYQPDRNSGVTATTAPMTVSATSVPITNPGAFLLPFGFAQIGTEIVAYSNLASNTMAGLIRGIGNTVAQAWQLGTVVNELSLFWNGRRIFDTPDTPGQSATVLPIPYGWFPILQMYMLGQAKKSEQDMQAGESLEKQAFAAAKEWMYSNKEIPTGLQVGGNNNPLVYSPSPAGGILVP